MADNENRFGQAFRIAPLIKGNTEQQRMEKNMYMSVLKKTLPF